MAATLYQFTSPDEIRAVLGVSQDDLEDETINLPNYVRQLQFDLADLDSTLEAQYLAVADIDEGSRTTAQQKLYDVTQVFSAYSISRKLLTGASLFAPRRITDGRAEAERVVDPFAQLREGVEANYGILRSRLLSALAGIGSTVAAVTSRSYFGTAGLAVNPVTNA